MLSNPWESFFNFEMKKSTRISREIKEREAASFEERKSVCLSQLFKSVVSSNNSLMVFKGQSRSLRVLIVNGSDLVGDAPYSKPALIVIVVSPRLDK